MQNIINFLTEGYDVFVTVLAIFLLIWGTYHKVKFSCLRKASEMVARIEGDSNMTGEEKFATVVLWINEELPSIFKNSFFQSIVDCLVDFAYNMSFSYMKKYIKRKTGHDISELIDMFKESLEETSENFENEEAKK